MRGGRAAPRPLGAPRLHLDRRRPGRGRRAPPGRGCRRRDTPTGCADPFAGGVRVGHVPFTGEYDRRQGDNAGLDGRLFTDLSKLATSTSSRRTSVLHPHTVPGSPRRSARLEDRGKRPCERSDAAPTCSRRWWRPHWALRAGVLGQRGVRAFRDARRREWSGVPWDVLALVGVRRGDTPPGLRVRPALAARRKSTPGASWIFTLDELGGRVPSWPRR